jgi:hypothetical protein
MDMDRGYLALTEVRGRLVDFRVNRKGEISWIEFMDDPDRVLMQNGKFRPIEPEELDRQLRRLQEYLDERARC